MALFNRNARFSFEFWQVIVECVSKVCIVVFRPVCRYEPFMFLLVSGAAFNSFG